MRLLCSMNQRRRWALGVIRYGGRHRRFFPDGGELCGLAAGWHGWDRVAADYSRRPDYCQRSPVTHLPSRGQLTGDRYEYGSVWAVHASLRRA